MYFRFTKIQYLGKLYIDANRGCTQNDWDTEQFPIGVPELTLIMTDILKARSFKNGGLMFEAKLRRQSADLFHEHYGGMEHLALALKKAAAIVENDFLGKAVANRY